MYSVLVPSKPIENMHVYALAHVLHVVSVHYCDQPCCFSHSVHRTLFWEDIPSLHSLSLQAIEDFFRRLRFCCACACVVCLYVCACLCGCDCVRACVCVCV